MIHDWISFVFLALVAIGLFIPLAVAARTPSEYSPLERVLYLPVYCLCRLLWRVEVVDGRRLNDLTRDGAIVVANHRCSLDPFFLQIAGGRRIHWMVAGEYFRLPVFGQVLRTLQAIPTNRSGADNTSIKTAIRLASEGRFVGMFPEGRINRSNQPLLPIRKGAALIASRAEVPIIPCWIEGSPVAWDVWSAFFIAAHVRIFVGEPIELSTDDKQGGLVLAMDRAAQLGNQKHAVIAIIESVASLKTS